MAVDSSLPFCPHNQIGHQLLRRNLLQGSWKCQTGTKQDAKIRDCYSDCIKSPVSADFLSLFKKEQIRMIQMTLSSASSLLPVSVSRHK
jgi:hypothetical protein